MEVAMRYARAAGFSLVELLIVVALVAMVTAMAVPTIAAGMRRYTLMTASQQVASTIRSARLQAVTKNRTMRIRFNCPVAGQFRVIEVTGNVLADTRNDRCETVAFPFPAADTNPATLPNLDGPVVFLPQGGTFGAFSDLQVETSGRFVRLTGCPACVTAEVPATTIVVSNGSQTRTITVSASGQVQLP
jgi:prepilin-type N-terminal cleavage/methylation domain-containing protein